MKRKILISFLVIFLILTLTGCDEMVAPGLPEWMEAENTVYNYWQAIINRQSRPFLIHSFRPKNCQALLP